MGVTWNVAGPTVYTEVSGTITFNDDDVKSVYVDWDDGIDNSLDNAIYQWEELKTDAKSVTLSHTYTKAGSFTPVIRTINSNGFLSKYFYKTGQVTDLPEPSEAVTGLTSLTVNDGNPTAVTRTENKSVLSGIDNNIFNEGPKDVYFMIAPLIASSSALITPSPYSFQINVTAVIRENVDYVASENRDGLGNEVIVRTITAPVDFNASTPDALGAVPLTIAQDGKVKEILKVELTNPKLIKSTVNTNSLINDFNKVKIFLMAKGNDGIFYPITYVSNGDPIKAIDDIKRTVKLDFSQSRTKASNKSISYYRYDSGKVWFEPTLQWQQSSSTKFNDNTKTGDSLLSKSYTYTPQPDGLKGLIGVWAGAERVVAITSGNAFSYGATSNKTYKYIRDQFVLNEYNQFYDQNHLTRLEAVSDSTTYSGLDTFNTVYRIRPVLIPTGATGYWITGVSPDATETSIHTSGAFLNGSGNAVNSSQWNVGPFKLGDGSLRNASEYYLLTNETKFNKIFFNLTTYAAEMESNLQYNSGSSIDGLYYLRVYNDKYNDKFTQNAEWVPLKFTDETKVEKEYRNTVDNKYETKSNTMSRSGYITFDMPPEWSNVPTISGLAGGFYNKTSTSYGTNNDYSKLITGTKLASAVNTPFNEYGVTVTSGLSGYTQNDIGNYKYIFEVADVPAPQNANDVGKVFWIVSSSADVGRLYLASGAGSTLESTVAGALSGYVRRVNIYDVIDGASKTSNIGLPPNYTDGGANYPYRWMVGNTDSAGTQFQTELTSNFKGYALKVVISGAANHFISGTSQPGMQIWNMFPYNNAHSQVIVEKDNTAYDLTYLEITSDISVNYASTYYQAISKGGTVFITRTGTPIQSIAFGGTALGDETQFKFNEEFTSYGTLRLLRNMQSEGIRVMWDEVQKDGTYVRFFGFPTDVTESHSNQGPRAPKPFSFNMVIEEICLLDSLGNLMSDIIPLGGIKDASSFK